MEIPSTSKGTLVLVLHAHLPFVRHPEHENFLEEDWLFEAVTEVYLPLLDVFSGLRRDAVPFRLTLSLSPTLISMLRDPLLQGRTERYLEKSLELAEKEIRRVRGISGLVPLAAMYRARLSRALESFRFYKRDLAAAFKCFQEEGFLEIITCPATHPFLPLLMENPTAARAQLSVALDQHEKIFGARPEGIWLPECGYVPGVDDILKDFDVRYFFLDAHGLLHGEPPPKFGVFAPVRCPSGVHAFGRDREASRRVWCGKTGYPADVHYRDFYRDIGFDLEPGYIGPYIQPDGKGKFTGIKYHRVTGRPEKEIYQREAALKKAALHAEDFLEGLRLRTKKILAATQRGPLFVCPFDAELFGHWWFEGPEWLDHLMRRAAVDPLAPALATPLDVLREGGPVQTVVPSASSWGEGGFNAVWLDEKNHWIYRELHLAAERMGLLAERRKNARGLEERILNQAVRELFLAQSSDWAFLLKTGASEEYAGRRIREHLENFCFLCDAAESGENPLPRLDELAGKNNLFPEADFRLFREEGQKKSPTPPKRRE